MKYVACFVVFAVLITSCAGPAAAAQPPREYLDGALNWLQTHAAGSSRVDWAAVRRDAGALVPDPPASTAGTYPAIRLALSRLNDANAFLKLPQGSGFSADFRVGYPDGIVIVVESGGRAERAGIRLGDVVQTINGAALKPFDGNPATFGPDFGAEKELRLTLLHPGENRPFEATIEQAVDQTFAVEGKPAGRNIPAGDHSAAYVEIAVDPGSPAYPGRVQQLMRSLDGSGACGWIVDLRRNSGGDIWTYLAALGPLLGDGNLGGFAYPDGKRDTWGYKQGKVFWNKDERPESQVDGGIYTPRSPSAPVALLTGSNTIAAGELVVIAFQGRAGVRTFGEPTRGAAVLIDHTPLSDGAHIFVGGAYATDRSGKIYDAPIGPDQPVKTDWTKFGTDEDPVIHAARDWLAGQPGCAQ